MNKRMTVTAGSKSNPVTTEVELNGVGVEETLTPKMAARAARIAFGHRDGVTVHNGERGYRLYKHSARRIKPEE